MKHLRPSAATGPGDRDDGVTTVLACACILLLIVLAGLVVQFGAAVLARHRAEAAADSAALAGAAEVLRGPQAACDRAAVLAAANGAALADCRVDGVEVLLTVTVTVRVGLLSGTAAGRARAGPVQAATG